jgi:hypothetical protein
MRIVGMSLAVTALLALGATACKDDGAADAADTPAASPTASPASPAATPSARPTLHHGAKPTVTGSQVIMIDPSGKRYTRKTMVQMAAGMSAVNGNGLPANFCAKSYADGVREGGTFPAGKAAFMEACQEGVRLAKQYHG